MREGEKTDGIWRRYAAYDAIGRQVYAEERFNNLTIKGAGDGLCWNGDAGPGPYFVFCSEEGAPFGYIGFTQCTGFTNDNIVPDPQVSPDQTPELWRAMIDEYLAAKAA